jgi:hypothetical protein
VKTSIAVLIVLAANSVSAQDRNPSDYTRLLLPVLESSPGANGSQWTVSLSLRNDGRQPLDAFPLRADCFAAANCLRIRDFPAFRADQDGFGEHGGLPVPFSLWVSGAPGAFLYVQRSAASQLSAHLQIGDSRRPQTPPATIPVVPESEFVSGRHSLVGIPTGSGRRMTIRTYQLNPKPGAKITIRAFEFGPHLEGSDFQPGRLLVERTAEFAVPALGGCPTPVVVCPAVPYNPGYVQISDLDVTSGSITQQIRIEFEPVDSTELYWPMVTITDNSTNAVQVFVIR